MSSTDSEENGFSGDLDRIAAFAGLLVEGLKVWRRQGRPVHDIPSKVRRSASPERHEHGDLRARIAAVLHQHGPLAPSEIGIRVGRSHRPVFVALTWLIQAKAVVAKGQTKGRRYSTVPDWSGLLSDALTADAQQHPVSPQTGEPITKGD
jgi:hypothetical protein